MFRAKWNPIPAEVTRLGKENKQIIVFRSPWSRKGCKRGGRGDEKVQ